MCGKCIYMCLGNDKMKPDANMTWKHKYTFIYISPLGTILHPKIFWGLNVDSTGEICELLDSMRIPLSHGRLNDLFQGAKETLSE